MDVAEYCVGIPSAIHSAGRNSNPSLPTTVQGLRGNDSHGLSDPYVNVFLAPSSKNVSMSKRPVLREPTGIGGPNKESGCVGLETGICRGPNKESHFLGRD